MLDSIFISFSPDKKKYSKNFNEQIKNSLDADIIYIYEWFDANLDEVIVEIIKNNPKKIFICFEKGCIRENDQEVKKRIVFFSSFLNFYFIYLNGWLDYQDDIQNLLIPFPLLKTKLLFSKEVEQTKEQEIKHLFSQLQEKIFYHTNDIVEKLGRGLLFKNFLENSEYIAESFILRENEGIFENFPAIIVGAGPSIEENMSFLKMVGNKAIIFACGTAISILSKQETYPHFLVAHCPRSTEKKAIEHNNFDEIPLLYSLRLNHECIKNFKGKKGVFISSNCDIENLVDDFISLSTKNILDEFPLTVVGSAICQAAALGCNPIYLIGVDLCFINDKKYFSDNEREVDENNINFIDIEEKKVKTKPEWLHEKVWIEKFLKQNPDLKIISLGTQSLPIIGVEKKEWNKVFPELISDCKDLQNKIQKLTEVKDVEEKRKKVEVIWKKFLKSFQNVSFIIDQLKILFTQDVNLTDFRVWSLIKELEDEISYEKILNRISTAMMEMNFAKKTDLAEDYEKKYFINKIEFLSELVPTFIQSIEEKL